MTSEIQPLFLRPETESVDINQKDTRPESEKPSNNGVKQTKR